MILQDGSPGSGSGQSQQDLLVCSLARRKKPPHPPPQDRPLPPIVPQQPVHSVHHPQPVFAGISNPAYARQHDQTGFSSSLSGARLNTTCETTVSIPEDSDEHQEVIEVQILPQDENWGETTTAVTNTSDIEYAMEEELSKWQITPPRPLEQRCRQHLGPITSATLALAAFLSPILMVVLPQLGVFDSGSRRLNLECDVTCDGMLISFAFKLLILLIGTWAVFFRKPKTTLPRIFVFRATVSLLVFVFVVSFWLFYGVHLLEESNKIKYADILEKYYVDFPIYNPYLDLLPGSRGKKGYKVYDVDGVGSGAINDGNSTVVSNVSKRGHNDRYHDVEEYERKVRKRRARLISATEESFTHIRRMREEVLTGSRKQALSPYQAAQAVFPSLSRSLQKYLRVTRQQPRHTMESILQHLSTCLSYDMSPRAFLEKYLITAPVLQNERELSGSQGWALICDTMLSRAVRDGAVFQLRQGDVSLLCSVHKLPHLSIAEEIIDPKSNKFVLRMSSETSV